MEITAIAIGNELLDGRVPEANAAFLGAFCQERGGRVVRAELVSDELEEIVAALERVDTPISVISGGLGPTSDDKTREAAAAWVGDKLEIDAETLETMRARFESRGYKFTKNNEKQAMFPSGARILPTQIGTAAGFVVERTGRRAYFFPGVRKEYRWFAEHFLDEVLLAEGDVAAAVCRLYFHGLGESHLETRLQDIVARAAELDVTIGYRAHFPEIEVKLSSRFSQSVSKLRAFILEQIGAWQVGEDEEGLSQWVGSLLLARSASVTAAESCTAGKIGAALTEMPGSSMWFRRGWVTYANEAKVEEVGVAEEIIERFGAVSAQTVCQMASGARTRAGAEFGLAVSGIAGPSGGSAEKPVGTVHFGLATPRGVFHRKLVFARRSRSDVREASTHQALSFLLWELRGRMEEHRHDGPFTEDEVWASDGVVIPSSPAPVEGRRP